MEDGWSSDLFVTDSVRNQRATAEHIHPPTSRAQVNYVNTDTYGRSYCVYSSDASTAYGVSALLLLLAGQAVAMVATRCFCCGRALSPGRWRAWSGICFVACW
jgi:hypothetical protein